jgi:hypothetical protein
MVKGCEMLVDVGLPSMSDCLGSGLEVYLIIGLFSYRVCDDSAVSQFWCYPMTIRHRMRLPCLAPGKLLRIVHHAGRPRREI